MLPGDGGIYNNNINYDTKPLECTQNRCHCFNRKKRLFLLNCLNPISRPATDLCNQSKPFEPHCNGLPCESFLSTCGIIWVSVYEKCFKNALPQGNYQNRLVDKHSSDIS